jgi:diguanylate cyclase
LKKKPEADLSRPAKQRRERPEVADGTGSSDLREKYLDALERLESGEARWSRLENVLRLTIGRLCLAGRGRSALLDDSLRTLGELVRRQPEPEDIEACLEPLSRAVAALDQSSAVPPAAASPQPAQPTERAGTRAAEPDRTERIQAAIVAMLERLALMPELKPALAELHERSIADLSADELADGLEQVARLVGEQRAKLAHEKLEIEDLLRQIDAKLEEVGAYLAGEASEQQSAKESTQQLNLLVLDEVHELNSDVQQVVDLRELRSRVRVRLEAIHSHLEDFRTREDRRFAAQTERTGKLRIRIAELERESRQLQRSLHEEQRLAMLDALTGIANRAAYDERIEHEFLRWQREGVTVSVLAWDIDRFKGVNDAYGHRAGDKVLRVVAQHLAQHVRGTDFVARYGGEEFVMVLVGTPAEQARVAADKIRSGIARIGFHFRGKPVTVTASCGITTFRADDTPDSVFDRADRALYRAKEAGRNCCVIL